MKISVITVTFNSDKTIDRTIRSVLRQQFRDASVEMEYLIIDGLSNDTTLEKAAGYSQAFRDIGVEFRIYTEKDNGIYDAMNKGIARSCGDIIGIINSDDWYELQTLQIVADTFRKTGCDLMYGDIMVHKRNGGKFVKKARMREYQTSRDWNHPTTFVRADVYKQNPFRNLGIHDDYGFFLQMKCQNRKIVVVDKVLANFTMGGASNQKSIKKAFRRMMDRYRYCYRINGYSRLYFLECVGMETIKMIFG